MLVVLVGVPGSGKSTFARHLSDTYERVCQDELPTKAHCINNIKAALSQGKPVIVDRTNMNREQRVPFLRIAAARNVPVRCVVFEPAPPAPFQSSDAYCANRADSRDAAEEPKRRGRAPPQGWTGVVRYWRDKYEPPLAIRVASP